MSNHGGDVYRNRVDIDFSVNVNPLGIPEAVCAALHGAVETCGQYPDREAGELRRAVSDYFSVPKGNLLFGNGASELFMALAHGIRPGKTVVPVPSFYGYEYAAQAVGSKILFYELKQENSFCVTGDLYSVLTEDVDLLFLANPNNPTGRCMDREMVFDILRHCREKGIYVVLDESFITFCGIQRSMLSAAEEFDNLILIRSFTKSFSIPGVRLGCLVCYNPLLLKRVAMQLPEWNLSCFAQAAGCACVKQAAFLEKTMTYTKRERYFLTEGLRKVGLRVFSSDANFILFYSEEPLYERLLKKGILIRDCSSFRGLGRGFYRVAVKNREENEILLKELSFFCNGGLR